MKKVFLTILILVLLTACTMAQEKGKRWALLMAIDKYPEAADVTSHAYAIKDLEAMQKLCVEKWSVPQENVIVLKNEEVTFKNIKTTLTETLAGKIGPDDYLIIYYSGVGQYNFPDFNQDEKNGSDQCIVPYDCESRYPRTYVTDDKFSQWLQSIKGKLILFMDFDGGYGMLDLNDTTGLEGRVVSVSPDRIESLNSGDPSFEHSVMCHFLIDKNQELYDDYQDKIKNDPDEAENLTMAIVIDKIKEAMKEYLDEKTKGELVSHGRLDTKNFIILKK